MNSALLTPRVVLVDNSFGVEQTEQELISRCLSGEEPACRQLYQDHAGMVAAYFRRSGFDSSLVADLTQETFVRVFSSLGGYDRARGAFRAWLSAIARNVARKYWRRRVAVNTFDPELADAMFAIPAEASNTPEQREENAAVSDCVARLNELLGQLIRLRYVRGMTTRSIATEVHMPESTVRSCLGEALDCIQRCLQGKGIVQ